MVNLQYVDYNTPSPGDRWKELSEPERINIVVECLGRASEEWRDILSVISAKQDGQVIVSLVKPLPANKRGSFLLDIEASLKNEIDPAIAIWLEPIGDRNSLRNLRGIEVKS